jgi:glycine oxidase
MYDGWIEELREFTAADTGFWRCGLLDVSFTDAETQEMQQRLAWQQAAGFNATWLDDAAVRKRHPHLSPHVSVRGALLFPDVAQVRPPRLLAALTEAIIRQGVQVRDYTPVTGITRSADRVTGVTVANGESIAAPVVVNCAGSWAMQVSPEMSQLPVKPIKGTIVLLETPAPPTREIFASSQGSIYPRADNKVLLGATVEDVGYDKRVTIAAVHRLIHDAVTLMPILKTASLVTAWSGLRPYSPDTLPFIGPVPGLQGAYAATGHFRSGILLAPITGLLIKEMILDQPPTMPLEPYRVDRFWTDR